MSRRHAQENRYNCGLRLEPAQNNTKEKPAVPGQGGSCRTRLVLVPRTRLPDRQLARTLHQQPGSGGLNLFLIKRISQFSCINHTNKTSCIRTNTTTTNPNHTKYCNCVQTRIQSHLSYEILQLRTNTDTISFLIRKTTTARVLTYNQISYNNI